MGDKNDILILTGEDGRELELEFLDTLIYNGKVYVALLPAGEEEKLEIIIMEMRKSEDGIGEFYSLGDEKELEAVFNEFKKKAENELRTSQNL
ncbi:hypothetical protein OXPF_01310 [Oxobacter pfennigii]|uniref:DUF1292 domain-containing protein n=1 Tax=Oxobacter pfennigii TaxID=36849 RepID=A0A0P9ALM5_9CLOT|nr:DUF1292 domain-containing protein [Oxobacter pfennigii]KPU46286.1 hypothetical protein OXPF_01310 [Oxobacter pfennigii]